MMTHDGPGFSTRQRDRGGLAGFRSDLRLTALRILRRPLYPAVAVAILALGLSAGIAVFTYVNGFSRPFPGTDPDGLVRAFAFDEESPYLDFSFPDYVDYASESTSFEGVAAVRPFHAASVRHETMTEVAWLEAVTGNYFGVLGIEMALGRGLEPADDRPGAESAAVLSYSWWQGRFQGDPDILGRTVYLNGRPFVVVGVAAPSHRGSVSELRPLVWIPMAPFRDRYTNVDRMAQDRDIPVVRVYARLREGVTREQATQELARIAAGLDAAYPGRDQARRVRLEDATWIDPRSRVAARSTNRVLVIAAVGFLVLVCANVANLLLSVFTGRRQEMAMHAALGASPRRLFGQVLVENVVLATIAGAIAVGLAVPVSTRLGSYFARPSVWGENVTRELVVDGRVLGFALVASLLTGLLAGILPAARASARNLVTSLKTGSGGGEGGRRLLGTHGTLVTTQVALSVVLLVVAGLVLRTLASVGDLDPGFDYEPLIGSHVSTSSTTVTVEERERWFHDLAEQISREPWVRSATVSGTAPLSGHRTADFRLDGLVEPEPLMVAPVHVGFFETMGIDLLAGRVFTPFDTLGAPDVVVLNQPMAERFFPDGDAVGRRIWQTTGDGSDRAFEVVGIVGPTKVRDFLAEPEPAVYLAFRQWTYGTGAALVLSTTIDPTAAVPLMQQWLRAYEPHMAIVNVLTYRDVVRGSIYTQRMNAELFAALAVLGLLLASVGIFSVVTLAVSRRTREIGIRKAIGARRGDINRLVIVRALTPVGLGLALGLAASFAAAGLVRGLLHGVEPSDPTTLVAGSTVLLLTALVAAWLPARRAGRVDPIEALRTE
jgi:predicted permease